MDDSIDMTGKAKYQKQQKGTSSKKTSEIQIENLAKITQGVNIIE